MPIFSVQDDKFTHTHQDRDREGEQLVRGTDGWCAARRARCSAGGDVRSSSRKGEAFCPQFANLIRYEHVFSDYAEAATASAFFGREIASSLKHIPLNDGVPWTKSSLKTVRLC
jgi:hypothetical protein